MFYIEKKGYIISDNDRDRLINTLKISPDYSDFEEDEIKETDREIENFMFVDSLEWVEWKTIQQKSIRNSYLEKYVDPYVTNPLRWGDMTEEEQNEIKNYRKYLLSLDTREDFCKLTILTFEEWKDDTRK